MSSFFFRRQATHTDTIAFSSLVIAGLLMLGVGTWSPLPEHNGATVVVEKAPVASEIAVQANQQIPVAAHVRG